MANEKIKILDVFPSKLNFDVLPLNCEILQAIYYEKYNKSVTYDTAIKTVSNQIIEIWQRARIPIVTERSLYQIYRFPNILTIIQNL